MSAIRISGAIGVDLGNVIIDGLTNDNTDTAFHSPRYMETTAVKGAFDGVKTLVEWFGPDNVYIISRCGLEIKSRSRRWLAGNKFYEKTGFREGYAHFCLERADKAPIAADLRLTHFVDDKAEVLQYMMTVRNRYLFGPQSDTKRDTTGLIPVPTWPKLLENIKRSAA